MHVQVRLLAAGTLVLTFFLLAAAADTKLRGDLAQALENAPPGALVPVSVVLRDSVTTEELRLSADRVPPAARRKAVTNLLKARAAAAQADLLVELKRLEAAGGVARIRPLWIGNVIGVDALPEVVRWIAARPEVAWVNHNPKVDVFLSPRASFDPALRADRFGPGLPGPEDGTREIECGVAQMRAPQVWNDLGTTGDGAVVAVIDTGVCWTHPDIANQIWVNPGEDLDHDGVVMDPDDENLVDDDGNGFVDDLIGWDFDFNDNEPNDDNSHGSHCAGTVAGDGTSGTEAGMAPDAKVMPVKVGVSFADEVDVWNAMQYAADNGADAISMSLGWPHSQNPDRATWRQNCENTIEAGTAMVIAAGNEGSGAEPDNVRTPGDVPRVITVGATDCGDVAAGFSSRGPVSWEGVPPYNDHPYPPGLTKPDVSAPGVDTKSHDVCSGYSFKSGTSMATPHVAGAVALMKSASPGLEHDDLKQILEDTAIDLGEVGKDNTYGSGRVDAYEAVLSSSTPNGRLTIKEAAVGCTGVLHLTVVDADLRGAGSVGVGVTSSTETTAEIVSLLETSATSGVFKGQIATSPGAAAPDGQIQVADGNTITATYIDANDGQGGTNVPKTDTALADCTGPVISNVAMGTVTDVQATIVWTTNERSDSTVNWGPTPPPTSSSSSGTDVTSHAVVLTGLQACTVYYFSVESNDPQGNSASDDNGGQYFHFETLGNFGSGLQPCHQGNVSLNQPSYSCSQAIQIKVVDLDLNLQPGTAETTTVTVSSTTESTPETVTLTETGPNTSQFTGSIAIATGAPVHGDGFIQAQHADFLTATYQDGDDGTGVSAVSFETVVADCAGPGGLSVRVTDVTDDSAIVRWTTSEPATSRVDWGASPALGNVVTNGALLTSHAMTVSPLTECGRFYFRVTSTDAYGNTRVFDASGAPFEFNAYRIPGLFVDNFETTTGWTLQGEWQIGAPQGLGSSPPDPGAAYAGTKVLGHDLTGLGANPGDYESQTNTSATSPVINASVLTQGQLKFRRWLNVGGGGVSYVEAFKNGTWSAVWNSNSLNGQTETSWSLQTLNIAQYADGNAQLQIRFRQQGGLQASAHRSGWNIDRFVVRSASDPDFTACGGCGGAPSFAGAVSAVDATGCADTGVTVSWGQAPGWGTGLSGTYAVYRSTDPGFTPSAANLIVDGVAGLSFTDASAPNGATLYYIVRAENNETCSTGPNNGGLVDGNLVRVQAEDETTQPAPGDVGATLEAAPINDAHVRLTWASTGTAAAYRVYRAPSAQGPYAQIAETTALQYDDPDAMGSGASFYYRVRAVDVCGSEGP